MPGDGSKSYDSGINTSIMPVVLQAFPTSSVGVAYARLSISTDQQIYDDHGIIT